MSRKYYTLLTKDVDGKWYPQFGDYSKKVVIEESRLGYRKEQTHIIQTDGKQVSIDKRIAELNAQS